MKSVFEKNFDIEKYVSKRVLEISDLSQRKMLKDTVSYLFMSLYEHMEDEYKDLQERIFSEIEINQDHFYINLSLVPRAYYDETVVEMVPMLEQDKEEFVIVSEELSEAMMQKHPFMLYTIFVQADFLVIKELTHAARKFRGRIHTKRGEFKAFFEVKPNKKYLRVIESLYEIFLANKLPWNTVHGSFLYKLFDVFLYSIEDFDFKSDILEIEIDFEEFNRYVYYDLIPMWNITKEIIKTSSYPEPCMDQIHYQHKIYQHKLDSNADYLAGETEIPLKSIARMEGDLVITCSEEDPRKWLLYKITRIKRGKQHYKHYPMLTNGVLHDFSDALSNRYQKSIRTRAELERFILALGCKYELQFEGFFITEHHVDAETYDMDQFIQDEFRTKKRAETLVLRFKPTDAENYLNRDTLSYITTRVQKIFPEYTCVGQIV